MKTTIRKTNQTKSIFVIDDSEWHNILLKKMLEDKGYEVQTFTDGRVLLERLKDRTPQMVISDINMPELDGFQLCDKIKGLPCCKDLPVMYVTSMSRHEVDEEVQKHGAVGMMQKPLHRQPFLDTVAQKM